MALTSQGHLRAEHLERSVTLQTESNNRVFSGLWRWLFILSLTLMPFDQAHESNGLNSLISSFFFFPVFTLCLGTSCHFHSLSRYSCHFSSRMFRSGQWQGVYTRKQWNERERNACRTRMASLFLKNSTSGNFFVVLFRGFWSYKENPPKEHLPFCPNQLWHLNFPRLTELDGTDVWLRKIRFLAHSSIWLCARLS